MNADDKAAVLRELVAYKDTLASLNGDDVLDEPVIRSVDNALDRAKTLLGDDEIPSLIPPEAAIDGGLLVRAGQASVIVAGVVARLQDPPRRARVWSPDIESPRRSW